MYRTHTSNCLKCKILIIKDRLEKISEYDEGILSPTTVGMANDKGWKKAVGHIEKLKFKYESTNGLYRQTIM